MAARLLGRLTPLHAALLAILLALPSLLGGLAWDDWFLRERLSPPVPLREGLASAFVFMDGDPTTVRDRLDSGFAPWWSLPDGKVAFWRPLAALSHALDFRLWPDRPALMHLHSLLWLGGAVAAVAVLFRRTLAPPVAALAALLYAVDEAHGVAAGWLSNRNILMATLFGALALLAHDRWRRDGWRPGAPLAPLALGLALLSAEAALGAAAYLAAHALCFERGWGARGRALAPTALVVALWLAARRAGGYGTWGTAAIEPLSEPGRFLAALPERAALLLAGQWVPLPPEVAAYLSPGERALWLLSAVAALAAVAAWLWPLRHDADARFWALGMALATVVAAGTIPAGRLLFFVGWGGMVLLAMGLREAAAGWRRPMRRAMIATHLIVAPLLLPLFALSPALLDGLPRAAAALPGTGDLARQTVVVVHAPSSLAAGYLPLVRAGLGLESPGAVRFLGAGPRPLVMERVDAQSVVVRPEGGFIQGFDAISRALPMAEGEVVRLEGLTVTVLALTSDGRPAEALFRFDWPLDDARYRWVAWSGGEWESVALPPVGERARFPVESDAP